MSTTEPSKWSTALGASADVNTLPQTTPSGSGLASLSGLFPQITQIPLDSGGIAPERADFNALFKLLGDTVFFLMQGGIFSYSASYAYRAGDLVMYNGSVYRCIQAHAAGTAAPGNTSYWSAVASAGDIPTKTSQLQNDSGFVTSASVPTKTSQLQNDSGFVTSASVPTKTSQLQNDSGFITASSLPTVNNGTLTIQQDGVTVGTFTANQSGNTTVNVTGGGGSGTIIQAIWYDDPITPHTTFSSTVGNTYPGGSLYLPNGALPNGTSIGGGGDYICVTASSYRVNDIDSSGPHFGSITIGTFRKIE